MNLEMSDFYPWLVANSAVLVNTTLSTVLAMTFIADTGVTMSTVLRGRAPNHVTMCFVLSLCTSVITLAMFAGREWAGRKYIGLYVVLWVTFISLWAVIFAVARIAHSSWSELERHNSSRSTWNVRKEEEQRRTVSADNDGIQLQDMRGVIPHTVAEEHGGSFALTSGRSAVQLIV